MIKTLVWFSEIPWDFLVQRHHHLVQNLPSEWKVIFLEPISRYKFRLRHLHHGNIATVPLFINGVLLEIPLLGLLFRLFNRIYLPLVLRWYAVKKKEFITVSSNVFVLDLAQRIDGRVLVYDCHDDVGAFPHLPPSTDRFFQQMVREAEIVICSSQALYSRMKVSRRNACVYIGNGVAKSFVETARNLERLRLRPAPSALGFVGVLSEWIDYDLLEKVARHFPQTELVIAGPVVKRCRRQMERLKAYPNVSLVGLVPYQSLPFYLLRLKVGIIPFKRSRLTFSVNPNKLYEYSAFGVRVVSTDFSEDVRQYQGRIHLAQDHEQFLEGIEKALLVPFQLEESILEIAEANAWEKQAAAFSELLSKMFDSAKREPLGSIAQASSPADR